MISSSRQAGFSLLEAVIALGVASYALVAAYGAFSGGAANLRTSNDRIAMMLIAEERLADLMISGVQEGRTAGTTSEGYAWTQTISLYLEDNTPDGPLLLSQNDNYALYQVEIAVAKDGGTPVILQTLKGRPLNEAR